MPPDGVTHVFFDAGELPPQQQLLAWRERLSHLIDVVPSLEQIRQPFRCISHQYQVGEFVLSDTLADYAVVDRTIARISRDSWRSIVFTIYLDGEAHAFVTQAKRCQGTPSAGSVFAVDLDQPVRLQRQACRHVTFFVPPRLLLEVFADPGALHGRTLDPGRPGTRLIVERVRALIDNIRHMPVEAAHRCLLDLAHLIAAAFGDEAGLSGSKRAIDRALMFYIARRYIHANLHDSELSPDHVVEALALPRTTIYRLFQHEGGLGAYIRHLRLRAAADDLIRFPRIPVKDVAYSVGFKSASDFTRAFRRAYDIAPHEVRLSESPHLGAWPPSSIRDHAALHRRHDLVSPSCSSP